MKKVLISGSFWHGSLEESYARAFESIGWHVIRFDWEQMARAHPLARMAFADKVLRSRIADRVGKWLIAAVQDYRPDVVFIMKGRTVSPDVLERLRGKGVLVNFNPDSPWEPRNSSSRLLSCIPLYDAHFTWNSHLIERFRQAGAHAVHFLPFAYDPQLHYPVATTQSSDTFDAVFVGTYDAERDKLLGALTGCSIGIWGNGWSKAAHVPRSWIQSNAIYGEDATRMLARAPCAINILRAQNTGSHNMRTFEIPATRTAMLTTRSDEQSLWFAEGESMECYEDARELREKIAMLKQDASHAVRIAEGGFERVREETYAKRVRTILDVLGL